MTESASDKSQEPLICANCGDEASSLLGGECIHKCSNAVEKEELRELIEEWRDRTTGGGRYVGYRGEMHVANKCADELEALLEE